MEKIQKGQKKMGDKMEEMRLNLYSSPPLLPLPPHSPAASNSDCCQKKSKSNPRRRRAKKRRGSREKEKESKAELVTYSKAESKAELVTYSHEIPQLRPRFPQCWERLPLDGGFAQTPALKGILGHYHEYIPSETDFVTKSFSLDSRLSDVYCLIAPSVVSVSSFLGVERKIDCSGIIIDWCAAEKEGTILTSAKVLWRLAYPDCESDCEFHLIVRMANGQLFLAREDHVDFYNNILTLKIKSEAELKVAELRGDIVPEGGMRVVAVGRTFYTYSFIDYEGELYQGYPDFGSHELVRSSCSTSHQICEGGLMITDTGHVLGMNFYGAGHSAHLLPMHVIQSCLAMWRSLGTVSRLWLGFSVVDVKQTPFHIQEKLNSNVVVKEVYDETLNVHSSDSVVSVNGIPVQSVKQFYQILSEASRPQTVCGDPGDLLMVVIAPIDHCYDGIIVIADHLPVDDVHFSVCWGQLKVDEWSRKKYGSQENPTRDLI